MIRDNCERHRSPWRLIVGVSAMALIVGGAAGMTTAVMLKEQARTEGGTSVTRSAPPSCVSVRYKTASGPESCESQEEVCELGAPWFVADIKDRCGTPKLARVAVYNTDLVPAGECLSLTSGTWEDATAMMAGPNAPAASCSAFVDMTEVEADGQPLTECVQAYPYTRKTFLAVITTPTGAMTACISANHGA